MIFNSFKKVFSKSIVAVIALSLFSCGSSNNEGTEETTDSLANAEVKTEQKSQSVFYSIPSPIQLGQLLQRAGAKYDKKLLSSTESASKYSTASSKALNLGVYGADLSFSAIFNQTQDVMNYLNSAKKMADDLGISNNFSADVIKNIEANTNNRDSLLQIISDIFMNSNEAFKENQQSNVSALVISGGFIEGLYVGTQLAKTVKDNKGIVTRIAELKGSVNNLVALLGTESDPEIAAIKTDLESIKAIYDEMAPVKDAKATVKADTTKKTMTIGGKSRYSLTPEQLDKITAKAAEIRAKIIKI